MTTANGVCAWPRRFCSDWIPVDDYLLDRHSLFSGDTHVVTQIIFASKKVFNRAGFGKPPRRENTTLPMRITKDAHHRPVIISEIVTVRYRQDVWQTSGSRHFWREMFRCIDKKQHDSGLRVGTCLTARLPNTGTCGDED